jgi:8-oxo-dGTP diphosphatase
MAPLHVAVGVVLDGAGNVLIARRRQGAHQGGLWEFPGGKVEAGESLPAALARELREELGIGIGRTSALLAVRHDYGDRPVLLDVHVVWEFSGRARPLEGQPLVWVAPQQLSRYAFPAANLPIVEAVKQLLAAGEAGNGIAGDSAPVDVGAHSGGDRAVIGRRAPPAAETPCAAPPPRRPAPAGGGCCR